jgi:hypothetical protein
MGACETTPTTSRDRGTSQRPPHDNHAQEGCSPLPIVGRRLPASSSFVLAPRLPARRCGRSSLTPARPAAQTGSDEETGQQQSPSPAVTRNRSLGPFSTAS